MTSVSVSVVHKGKAPYAILLICMNDVIESSSAPFLD